MKSLRLRFGVAAVMSALAFATVATAQPLKIDPERLDPAETGEDYCEQLTADGGEGTLRWAVEPPSVVPPGLTLSADGQLCGRPDQPGDFRFFVRVTDSAGATDLHPFLLIVEGDAEVGGLPVISTLQLPQAQVGERYRTTLEVSFGVGPYEWEVASDLPDDLELDEETGELSGIPEEAGNYRIIVAVTDGNNRTDRAALTLEVVDSRSAVPDLRILSDELPPGVVGQPYEVTLLATGGGSGYRWMPTDRGNLPPGLNLRPDGTLQGTPRQGGEFRFGVELRDRNNLAAFATLSLEIGDSDAQEPLEVDDEIEFEDLAQGRPFYGLLEAEGGARPYRWNLARGAVLPTGLSLDVRGFISGTPRNLGEFSFGVTVTDRIGQQAAAEVTIEVVERPDRDDPFIATRLLPVANVGQPYRAELLAEGGEGAYTWSLGPDSALPAGLTLDTANGVILGVAQDPGRVGIFLVVTDEAGTSDRRFYTLQIVGGTAANAPRIRERFLPNARTLQAYQAQLTVQRGAAPYAWELAPNTALPPGLSLSANGTVSGTPSEPGDYTFEVEVTDANARTDINAVEVSVFGTGGSGLPDIVPADLPHAIVGEPYNASLEAISGTLPYTWGIEDVFDAATGQSIWDDNLYKKPWGLGVLLDLMGEFSGTPTQPGEFIFMVSVADAENFSDTERFVITVDPVVSLPWYGDDALGEGWYWLAWMESPIYPLDVDWSWHPEHGMLYVAGTDPASLWWWFDPFGWVWTGSGTYPFLYRDADATFLWYELGSRDPRNFYNFTTESWETTP